MKELDAQSNPILVKDDKSPIALSYRIRYTGLEGSGNRFSRAYGVTTMEEGINRVMQVIFYATLRQIVGARMVEIEALEILTVRELLAELIHRYPALAREMFDEDGNLYSHVRVMINGRDLSFVDDNLEARISSADTISIFPAVGGG